MATRDWFAGRIQMRRGRLIEIVYATFAVGVVLGYLSLFAALGILVAGAIGLWFMVFEVDKMVKPKANEGKAMTGKTDTDGEKKSPAFSRDNIE